VQKLLRETGAKGLVAGEGQAEPPEAAAESRAGTAAGKTALSPEQRQAVEDVLSELTSLREMLRKGAG
jgi:hypothetical protein